MPTDRIIAIGLLTREDLQRLGGHFSRLFPVDDAPWAADLLKAIDEADAARSTGGAPVADRER